MMPYGKKRKEQNKKKNFPLMEQPQIWEIEKQDEHPKSDLVHIDSKAKVASCDIISSISLTGSETSLLNDTLINSQENQLLLDGGICLNKNIFSSEELNICKEQFPEKVEQESTRMTVKQGIDEIFLNVIESADLDQIMIFLQGNHTFSQNGLDRALILACHLGFKYLVQTLVRLGANVHFRDTHENTPLLICAGNRFVDIVHFLLKKKADVNAFNSSGDTALILSIKASGSSEMVNVLLEEGIDISHQNHEGHTALMKAILVRDVDVMKLLMDKYLEVDASNNIFKHSSLESIQTISPTEMVEQEVADKCGLRNIYNILKTTQESPLLVAIENRDTESLNTLLDCDFIENYDVSQAFKKIFQNCELKEVKAVSKDEIVMITRLLECGADMGTGWYNGSNPLTIAVEMGAYNLVELLCQSLNQEQPNWNNGFKRFGTEALSAAVRNNHIDLIELLLSNNADINGYNYSGSPLDCAFVHGHLESAKLLIQRGAKMNIESALYSAVTKQVPEYLHFILSNYQHEVITYAANGADNLSKLLMLAVKGGNLEIIKQLLDAGADVNQENLSGEIPLVESKNGDVVRFLISRGANVNKVMQDRDTPLIKILVKRCRTYYLSSRSNCDSSEDEIVKVLLENGASVNENGKGSRIPLMIAASKEGNIPMLQILLDNGADLYAQDNVGNTALMCAVSGNCPQNMSFLLEFAKEKDLDLNVQDINGSTAVMLAANSSSPKMLKELVNFNVDVNIKDMSGNTALMHALLQNFMSQEILTTLINAGSDVNCQNNDGFSPLMLATRMCWKEAILILIDSGADVNAVSKKNATKTAITFLPTEGRYERNIKSCLEVLLRSGASSSYTNPSLVHKLILFGDYVIVPELIRCGLGPVNIKPESLLPNFSAIRLISAVSPLCSALLVGNVSLAHYFVEKLFLTNTDITSLTDNKNLRHVLGRMNQQDSLTFLDKICSQPMSLFQLVFVSVSSALGTSPGRENRVNILPLPQLMKDKLLFKSEDVQLDITSESHSLNVYQVIDSVSIFEEIDSDQAHYFIYGNTTNSSDDDYADYDVDDDDDDDTYW